MSIYGEFLRRSRSTARSLKTYSGIFLAADHASPGRLQTAAIPMPWALALSFNKLPVVTVKQCRDVADRDNVRQATSGDASTSGPNWNEDYAEDATAIVIHHTSILRNKRLLLAYQCVSSAR